MPDVMLQPGDHLVHIPVEAIGGGSSGEQALFVNRYGAALKLVGASFQASAAVTGDDTNNMTLSVVNKTGPKTALSKQFVSGEDIAQWGDAELDPSATEADLEVAQGDSLTLVKSEAAAGLALPAGTLSLRFRYAGK